MKFNINQLINKQLFLKEKIDFTDVDLSSRYSLKAINDLNAEATISMTGDLVHVTLFIEAQVLLECAYTLDIFPDTLSFEEELFFTDDEEEENEDIYFERGPMIDLDPYIIGLLLASIPLRVIKPGATLPEGNDVYEVISEDEYNENMKKRPTPFDDLDLEEFPD